MDNRYTHDCSKNPPYEIIALIKKLSAHNASIKTYIEYFTVADRWTIQHFASNIFATNCTNFNYNHSFCRRSLLTPLLAEKYPVRYE